MILECFGCSSFPRNSDDLQHRCDYCGWGNAYLLTCCCMAVIVFRWCRRPVLWRCFCEYHPVKTTCCCCVIAGQGNVFLGNYLPIPLVKAMCCCMTVLCVPPMKAKCCCVTVLECTTDEGNMLLHVSVCTTGEGSVLLCDWFAYRGHVVAFLVLHFPLDTVWHWGWGEWTLSLSTVSQPDKQQRAWELTSWFHQLMVSDSIMS